MVESAVNRTGPPERPARASSNQNVDGKSFPKKKLRAVVLDHYEEVYRYAYRLSGKQADAEDLCQQTFLLAHRKLHQLRDEGKLKSWLFTILRSCFLKSCRANQPLTGQELLVDELPAPHDDDEIDREQLQLAINELPEEFRLVVMMFYFDGLSYKEIAAELELPTGTVMSRLSRAKGRLRRRLTVADSEAAKSPRSSSEQVPSSRASESCDRCVPRALEAKLLPLRASNSEPPRLF